MATSKKFQGHIKTMIIGGFTVFGIAILVWGIFFFKPSVGDNKNKVTVKFANIEGVDVGTRVTYAGKPVGEVTEITYIPRNGSRKLDTFGNPYAYEVTMKFDSSIHIYSSDLIEIRTLGLLGEKSIAIIPQDVKPGEEPQPINDGVVYANSEDPLTTTLKTVQVVSEQITTTMKDVSNILQQNQGLINQSMQSLSNTLEDVSEIVFEVRELDVIGNFNEAILNVCNLTDNANQMMNQAREMQLLEKMDDTLGNVSQITSNIASGKGTLGKLINDPTLYLKALSMIDRVNQLIYDLNHFGLLFHRNRAWKELQQQRLNQIEELKSPDAFTQAFEQEMAQIEDSLKRVSEMVDQAEMGQEEVLDSKAFKKYFFDLLQQVNQLQNLIDLYNQKLAEKKSRT